MFSRRNFLRSSSAVAGSLLISPRIVFANVETERRFVFIIQRGAADGLSLIPPHGDPAYGKLRGAFADSLKSNLRLDGTFALHPSLSNVFDLYTKQEALMVHAVASSYRERSHFDGQNVLETGGTRPYQFKDGWLNRLCKLLPKTADEAIAFSPTIPVALRGDAEVTSYSPSPLPEAPDDILMRIGTLYEKDHRLHAAWSAAMEARGLSDGVKARQDPASIGKMAAGFLARANGPRIAMIETSGWDTHSAQERRLKTQLSGLDALIGALRERLAATWALTTVLVATEFGRTVAINGTGGTDHGTASAAMIFGGNLKGGRMLTDWPALKSSALYEGRDLKPTLDLDYLISVVAAEGLNLDQPLVARTLFPTRQFAGSLGGLYRS